MHEEVWEELGGVRRCEEEVEGLGGMRRYEEGIGL
jgi:hypothetical protein